MKLLAIATIFAAVLPAATINFTTANTTLAGGEVITIGAASATFTALPKNVVIPVSADTTINGSGITNFAIDVPWDVDSVSAVLRITGKFTPGATWVISGLHWEPSTLPTPDATGYPIRINRGGDLAEPNFSAAMGGSATGHVQTNIWYGNVPEPSTFILIGLMLPLLAVRHRLR